MTIQELREKIKSGEYAPKIEAAKEAAKKKMEQIKAAIAAKNNSK